MKVRQDRNIFIVRLDPGEAVVSSLGSVCEENNIEGALIQGIGALKKAKIITEASTEKLVPEFGEIEGPIEFTATGDASMKEGKIHIHLHAALGVMGESRSMGKREIKNYSTHLAEGIISLTGEFFIIKTAAIERELDAKTGLWVWKP